MIKFFRNIRQQLLTRNKLNKSTSPQSRYLIYAIGEIILVVIGILIALQINNWNEDRKAEKQISLLLNNLVESIEQDIGYLNHSAVLHEFRSNSLLYLLKHSGINAKHFSIIDPVPKLEENNFWEGHYPDTLNTEFINRAIIYSGVNDDVIINENILDELKNTGLFSVIKNDNLKKAINTYYSYVQRYFLIDDWNADLTDTWRKFLRDSYGVLATELYFKDDPLIFIKQNEPVQVRIYEMISPARFRSNNATYAITLAKNVTEQINKYQRSK